MTMKYIEIIKVIREYLSTLYQMIISIKIKYHTDDSDLLNCKLRT